MQAITALVREGRLDPEDVVDHTTGNVAPGAVENAFRRLKPKAEYSRYANLWQHLRNDDYVEGYQAMGQWTRDHVPFPGAAFRQTVEQPVRANGLMDGSVATSQRAHLLQGSGPGPLDRRELVRRGRVGRDG